MGMFLATFFVWMLSRPQGYDHALVLLGGGGALLFLGANQRNRDVVFLCAPFLVLSFWIQFFIKLHQKTEVPWWGALIVFGVAVLASAICYERKLKHVVKRVSTWPSAFCSPL